MATLLLRIRGPMQSWGLNSQFEYRASQMEPTKSGIIGLLCAALGRDRAEPLEDLAALSMGVRIDKAGELVYDYQTTLEVAKADGSRPDTQTSRRYYLSDAAFWVGLEGDKPLLLKLEQALNNPVWPIFLGRKAYLPSEPVIAAKEEAVSEQPLLPTLLEAPAINHVNYGETIACVLEVAELAMAEGSVTKRVDVPISFALGQRKFTERLVASRWFSAAQCPALNSRR